MTAEPFLTEAEARSFREPVAKFLASLPEAADRATWLRLATELELLGVAVPEYLGGLGLSLAHAAIVSEELGRRLSDLPFLASAGLATSVLLNLASTQECDELLPELMAGRSVATVAVGEAGSEWSADGIASTVRMLGGQPILSGRKLFVQHGMAADQFLVLARPAGDGARQLLCLASADAAGLTRRPMTGLDPSRPLAELDFADVPVRLLGTGAERDVAAAFARAVAEASVLLSAEAIGAAAECLRMCVEYGAVRRQFGHPIGSFQAVQHRAADMYGELESARAAVEVAAAAVQQPGFEAAAAVARARSADAFAMIARETIQLHGGIGFTWEHPAHRYFKRSLVDLQLLGHPDEHRRQLASQLSSS